MAGVSGWPEWPGWWMGSVDDLNGGSVDGLNGLVGGWGQWMA